MAVDYDVFPQALSKFIHPVHCPNHFKLGKLQMMLDERNIICNRTCAFHPKYMLCVICTAVCRVHNIVIALATVST